jgi:hypothetical protein
LPPRGPPETALGEPPETSTYAAAIRFRTSETIIGGHCFALRGAEAAGVVCGGNRPDPRVFVSLLMRLDGIIWNSALPPGVVVSTPCWCMNRSTR